MVSFANIAYIQRSILVIISFLLPTPEVATVAVKVPALWTEDGSRSFAYYPITRCGGCPCSI